MRDPSSNRDGVYPGMAFESATWHTTLDIVREMTRSMHLMMPPSRSDLEWLAAEIEQWAPRLVGDMPWEVEAFLQTHRAGAGG